MTLIPVALGTRSNPARDGHAGAARLINCYAEQVGEEGKATWNIHACDGFTAFAEVAAAAGGVRAALPMSDNEAYAVMGRLVVRLDASGSATVLGGIPSGGMVTMARNRVSDPQVAIVCDGLYFGIQGGALSQLADTDLPPPVSVAQLNGYFSFLLSDGRHFASELDDWDVTALSFASASYRPDLGVRNWVRGQDLCIGGQRSIEFLQDVGGDPYPFQRVTAVDVGVLAPRSVADIDQTSAFVAHDGTVRVLDGYQARRISGHALERLIASEPAALGISACSWQERGHTFYSLSGTGWTWVYDAATDRWHERKSYGLDRWRIDVAFPLGRSVIFGDYAAGKLYKLAPDAQAAVHAGSPQVLMMDYSDDGGATWSVQRTASLGELGQRSGKVRFHRLGISRARSYRLSMNAAVEAGAEMVMTIQTPPVHGEPYRLRHNELMVDVVPGLGAEAGRMTVVSAHLDADKLRV